MFNKKQALINVQNKEDKILFSKIIDQLNFCVKNYESTFSDFLPILKYLEIKSILANQVLKQNILFFGGFEEAERGIIGFFQNI